MAIIQSARFAQFYRRLASLKESFVPDLQDIVMPTAELVNPFAFDLFRPRGENVVGFTAIVGPVAAQNSQVWVVPGPGMFFVPLYFMLVTSPAALVQVAFASKTGIAAGVTFANAMFNLDTRGFGGTVDTTANIDPNQMAGGARYAFTTLAPVGVLQNLMFVPTGLAQLLQVGLVLSRQNTALVFVDQAANSQLILTVIGYERAFETQENV